MIFISHFTVGVVTRHKITSDFELEDILAPFCEQDERFFQTELEVTRMDAIQFAKQEIEKAGLEHTNYTEDDYFNWAQDWTGYQENANGDLVSHYNPNAKWDWYVVGGRWNNVLKDKYNGKYSNSVKLSSIDWRGMKTDKIAEMDWESYTLHYGDEYKQKLLASYNNDLDKWKDDNSNFYTHSILTPSGEWLEAGEVGWFGTSSESDDEAKEWRTNYRKLFRNFPPDYYLTIVDCHI